MTAPAIEKHDIRLVTAQTIADLLEVRVNCIYEWARNGVIPVIMVNTRMRFDYDEIVQWLRAGGTKPRDPNDND